ncbi:bifunctional precorrin-2 dehydrogenase/sirohydrochlorin ferrochelatase [Halopenitus sp. H-Gu1]|uniref:precorrin-2 dehydrogenase/sirohydrochlorin ferrochelatase family protein n=1 Tax=Halopenitus sp. H-Gu1 TaxID=3242697 RepID=UPI00359F0671
MIPLVHDLADETVLVVGGGTVATRKVRRFAAEARVIVVSPTFADALRSLADDRSAHRSGDEDRSNDADGFDDTDRSTAVASSIELVRHSLDPSDLRQWVDRTSPALVIAATDDPAVNAAAEAAAREHGALVNRTDESGSRDAGSVVVPATIEDGPVTVAITTGANSPALARHLRERIETEIEGAGELARITAELRTELADRDVDPDTRREAIRSVVRSPDVWKALHVGGTNPRQTARRIVERTCNEDGMRTNREEGT